MDKLWLDYKDLMDKFHCGRDKARGYIRAIKLVSDTLGMAGRVSTADFELWFNQPLNKLNKKEDCLPTPISQQSSNNR